MVFRRFTPAGLAWILAGCSQPASEPTPPPAAAGVTEASVATSPPAATKAEAVALVPPPVTAPESREADKPDAKEKGEAGKPDATKKGPPKASELKAQALKRVEGGDLPEAIRLLDEAVAAEPGDPDTLWLLARITRHQAVEEERPKSSPLYLKYAEVMRKLKAASKGLGPEQKPLFVEALYNEACTYAIEGKNDQAMKVLKEAVASGFDQPDTLKTDVELEALRKLPEFQKLEKEVAEKAEAHVKEEAKELLANNKPFKFDFELPGHDGKKVALADFKGKVTIVDLWATWCPPCRAEVPHFVALYQKYHDKGLEIVGLNYEREDDEAKAKEVIKAFVAENKVPYPCLIGDDKTQNQVPDFEGYPTTLFLDRAGTVRAKMVGFDPSHAVELEMIVQALLAEKP